MIAFNSRGRFHQHALVAILRTQVERLFLAHNVWQTANKFGYKCSNLSSKFGVLMVSISSTFYVRIFCKNVVSAAFFLVTCRFRVRRLYKKRAHIKLMKLTDGWWSRKAIFLPNAMHLQVFAWQKKFGEIDWRWYSYIKPISRRKWIYECGEDIKNKTKNVPEYYRQFCAPALVIGNPYDSIPFISWNLYTLDFDTT